MSATPRLSTLLLLATALPACSGLGERLCERPKIFGQRR